MQTPYFLLSLSLLLDSTKDIKEELFFQTLLPAQRISKEECLVQLWLYDGIIRFYEIKELTGRSLLVQPEQIIDLLNSLGMLAWYRAPPPAYRRPPEQSPLSRQASSHSRLVTEHRPIRKNSNAISNLDHFHRQVFSLVDATRDVGCIAKLLRKDPEAIMAILQDLQAQDLITFQIFLDDR